MSVICPVCGAIHDATACQLQGGAVLAPIASFVAIPQGDYDSLRSRLAIAEARIRELESDESWKVRAKEALENGTCPICFCGDEDGHEDGCAWGADEAAREAAESRATKAENALQGWLVVIDKIKRYLPPEEAFHVNIMLNAFRHTADAGQEDVNAAS